MSAKSKASTLRARFDEARNSPMRYRFFLVESGPVFDEIQKCRADRRAARDSWFEFAKSIGVKRIYGGRKLIGIELAKPIPLGWKVCPTESTCMVPDKKTTVGRAFQKTMDKLPTCPVWSECLTTADIDDAPYIIDGSAWYRPQIIAGNIAKRFAIKIAWRDYPADVLAHAAKDKSGLGNSCEVEFVTRWKPLPSMKEIKEWEALKIFDEDEAKP